MNAELKRRQDVSWRRWPARKGRYGGGRHDRPAIERAGHEVRAGAHPEGDGVRFAVFSSVAEGVDLCVFNEGDRETRHPLELGDGSVWHGHVPGAGHGTRYEFVHDGALVARGLCNCWGYQPIGGLRAWM